MRLTATAIRERDWYECEALGCDHGYREGGRQSAKDHARETGHVVRFHPAATQTLYRPET